MFFWNRPCRGACMSEAMLTVDGPEVSTPEEFCAAMLERESKRHAKALAGIEAARKRLKSGKARNVSSRGTALDRLFVLRNELVEAVSDGHFADAASREWKRLPLDWRKAFLVKAGIGMGVADLAPLASRSWQEFPPPERDEIRKVIREARALVPKLFALGARL